MKKAIKIIGLCCVAIIIIVGVCMAIPSKTLDFRGTVTAIEKSDNETTFKISSQSAGSSYIVVADNKTKVEHCHADDPAINLADIEIGDTIEGNYRWLSKNNKAKFITVLCINDTSTNKNQTLTLSFELNNKTHTYNIEYDSDNNIVKVDNTDYYEFLEDGELITDVTILDTELTDYFVRNGGKSKGNEELSISQLQEKYPMFFDVSTDGGLTVYVWQMSKNSYSCYLVNTADEAVSDNSFAYEVGATIAEMRAILTTYDIDKKDVTIQPVTNPLSSYSYEINDEYRTTIKELFWKD